jgi:hypothetical protein
MVDTMSLEDLIKLAGGTGPRRMPNAKLVKDWWPKPTIRTIPEKYWGDKWSNNRGILHKYECFSFSHVGFHSGGYRGVQTDPNLPGNVCLAYGETPEQAYDQWCSVFKVWNDKEDWVK